MLKTRVHELAKKYNKENREILEALNEIGLQFKSHLTAIEPKELDKAISHLDGKYIVKTSTSTKSKPTLRKATLRKKVAPQETQEKEIALEKEISINREKNTSVSDEKNMELKPTISTSKKESGIKSSTSKSASSEDNYKKVKKESSNNFTSSDKPASKGSAKDKNGKYKKDKNTSYKNKARESREYGAAQFASRRSKKKQKKIAAQQKVQDFRESLQEERIITCGDDVTVKILADKIGVGPAEIVKHLFMKGHAFNINSLMPFSLIEEIALKYNVLLEREEQVEKYEKVDFSTSHENSANLVSRPPIVTVMGHVDHGKTSLLDAIRASKVTSNEAGGITQRIGAYQVSSKGKTITFIDTPGHEAFTEMRARGTSVTDIVVLVVAADDGVKPQTIEAISHAKVAQVPIIVAINKIDKPNVDVMKVKQGLAEHGILAPDWGGENEFVEVSAMKGTNIDKLLETIALSSEVLELKADPKAKARCIVLESRLDSKVGPVADLIVRDGSLKRGDVYIVGEKLGKIRSMINDSSKKIEIAQPSSPVEITGLSAVPHVGEMLEVYENEKEAKRALSQLDKKRAESLIYSNVHAHEDEGMKNITIILKADSKGTLEAIRSAIVNIENDKVKLSIIHASVGAISEGDIKLASSVNGSVVAFDVPVSQGAKNALSQNEVKVKQYSVIYQLIEELEEEMNEMLTPTFKDVYQGTMVVQKIFSIPKVGTIAGGVVTEGKIVKDSFAVVIRDSAEIKRGKLSSLKKYAEFIDVANLGQECGISIDGYTDFKEGDYIKSYLEVEN